MFQLKLQAYVNHDHAYIKHNFSHEELIKENIELKRKVNQFRQENMKLKMKINRHVRIKEELKKSLKRVKC